MLKLPLESTGGNHWRLHPSVPVDVRLLGAGFAAVGGAYLYFSQMPQAQRVRDLCLVWYCDHADGDLRSQFRPALIQAPLQLPVQTTSGPCLVACTVPECKCRKRGPCRLCQCPGQQHGHSLRLYLPEKYFHWRKPAQLSMGLLRRLPPRSWLPGRHPTIAHAMMHTTAFDKALPLMLGQND